MGSSWGLALRDAARAFAARRGREEGEEEAAVDEAGFTLIELMVVLLIMGILMAIAIPTFLGAASGAHDKASQSDLTNAMTSAKTVYASNGSYLDKVGTVTKFVSTELQKAEPEMKFGTTTTKNAATHIAVSVVGGTGTVLELVSYSGNTTNCWFALDNEKAATVKAKVGTKTATPGISYGLATGVKAAATCSPTTKLTSTWGHSWPKS